MTRLVLAEAKPTCQNIGCPAWWIIQTHAVGWTWAVMVHYWRSSDPSSTWSTTVSFYWQLLTNTFLTTTSYTSPWCPRNLGKSSSSQLNPTAGGGSGTWWSDDFTKLYFMVAIARYTDLAMVIHGSTSCPMVILISLVARYAGWCATLPHPWICWSSGSHHPQRYHCKEHMLETPSSVVMTKLQIPVDRINPWYEPARATETHDNSCALPMTLFMLAWMTAIATIWAIWCFLHTA